LYNADATAADGAVAATKLANALLAEAMAGLPDCHPLDYPTVIRRIGAADAFGGKYWYMGRIPFSAACNKALARKAIGVALALEGRTTRLIVLDLDNTLWGGVVGDDGVGGIALGGDYPGNVFKQWQRYLKALSGRGVALAVCSKNTYEVALEAIETHADMVLHKDDFAALRINWEDKGSNVLSICEEVNLGPQSVMFLDDNSLERQWVRARLPECVVPDLPEDPSRWIAFLSESPFLESAHLTDEDRKRSRQYVMRRRMADQRQSAASVDEYLHSLGMVVTVDAYDAAKNAARVLQLFAKTNQCNTTTTRYSQTDLEALIARGGRVLAVSLEDAMFEREIIAAVALVPGGDALEIDCLVMSCRAMGRGVESAALAAVARTARKLGFTRLRGRILPTPKNGPVRDLYAAHGFSRLDETTFERDVAPDNDLGAPEYITLKIAG
jgi:FkbH-like protein